MNYLFINNSGETLPIAVRLKKEGHKVTCYIHNKNYRQNYNGLLNKVSMNNLKRAVGLADLIIFDMNKPVESKEDRALQKIFKANGSGLYGPIADAMRKSGKVVFGCSTITEQLELDRQKGSELAKKIGMAIPESRHCGSLSEGVKFLKSQNDKLYVFKPFGNQDLDMTYVEQYPGELFFKLTGEYKVRLPEKVDFLLQEKIEGVEISTEAFFTGKKWILPNHTIEDKRFLTGDLGPNVGSMNNTVWLKRKKGLNSGLFEKLTQFLIKAGYIGPWDINCIVSEKNKKPYFLEHTPRLGYDAIYNLLTLLNSSVSTFFEYVSGVSSKAPRFRGGFASSIRVSIPPYPYETPNLLEMAKNVDVAGDLGNVWLEDIHFDNGYKCSGADGIIGVVAMKGKTIKESADNVYKQAEKIKIGSQKQYRTDLGERSEKARARLREWNIEVD